MKHDINPENESLDLHEKMGVLDSEFKDFLTGLRFVQKVFSDDQMSTYSPLDVVADFEHRGLQRLPEVSADDIMNNEGGLKKLLANMLQQCRPGSLTSDDVDQLSGINGRSMRTETETLDQ